MEIKRLRVSAQVLVSVFVCVFGITVPSWGKEVQRHPKKIDGRYMVLLDQNLPSEAYDHVMDSLLATYHGRVAVQWRDSIRGFVITGLSSDEANRLVSDPRVEIVEEDFLLDLPATASR